MKKILFFLLLSISVQASGQQQLPDLELRSLTGEKVNLNTPRQKALTVYSFWATWCIPCINELDAISEYYEEWKEQFDLELIAVSIDDARKRSKVRPMVSGKMWDYEVLLDENQDFKRAMNIATIPYLFIVSEGKVVYSHNGYTPGFEEELYEEIKALNSR